MTRTIILTAVTLIASLVITPIAEAKKGAGGNWKGPPHGNAWGHYKAGWPGYWYGSYPYGGYSYGFVPPSTFGVPPGGYLYPPAYAPAPPVAPVLPPPPPAY